MRALLILIFTIVSSNLFPQVVTMSDATVTFVDLPKKISEVKRSSVSIEKADKNLRSTLLGSGFIVIKHGLHYAITNYHVVKNVTRDELLLIGYNSGNKKWHSIVEEIIINEMYDIAVLKMDKSYNLNKNIIDSTLSEPSAVGISIFESTSNIIEGVGAIIIGYPLGLGAEYSGNKPISRIGIVAQSPNEKTNTFFLDCIVSHGNSGSPVFNEKNLKLMGMVTSYKPENINLYDKNGTLKFSLPDNSGIAICVTAEMINKVIP